MRCNFKHEKRIFKEVPRSRVLGFRVVQKALEKKGQLRIHSHKVSEGFLKLGILFLRSL